MHGNMDMVNTDHDMMAARLSIPISPRARSWTSGPRPPATMTAFREEVEAQRHSVGFSGDGTKKDIELWDEIIKGRAPRHQKRVRTHMSCMRSVSWGACIGGLGGSGISYRLWLMPWRQPSAGGEASCGTALLG